MYDMYMEPTNAQNIEDINWGKKAFFRETGQTLETMYFLKDPMDCKHISVPIFLPGGTRMLGGLDPHSLKPDAGFSFLERR